jgi:hypothetical protein
VTPEVIKLLSESNEPKELHDFRQKLQDLVKMSRDTMSTYYDIWDRNDLVYRGERMPDPEDKKAIKRKEPAKVFNPLTHTQVQTFVSFGTMLFTQRPYFFELDGAGIEDVKPAKLAQACLQRDLEYNKWEGVLLPQFLTDCARFGLGILKTQWDRDVVPIANMVPDPDFAPDPNLPTQSAPPMIRQWTTKTKYLGNKLEVTSPYRWFPDTRIPLTRYRDGEFCADENDYARAKLKSMERLGTVAGVDHIPQMADDVYAGRQRNSADRQGVDTTYDPTVNPDAKTAFVLINEVEIRLNPSKTKIGPDQYLDPEIDADIIALVWIANDGRIIRIEGDMGYDHNEFLWDASQFFNDQNRLVNFGIAELIAPMQDLLDWLMNSRITNVRKSVQNWLVVDPRNIEMQDLKDRNPVLRLKSTVPEGMSIDSYIKQLKIEDTTHGHLEDASIIEGMSQQTTGLNDNLMGDYASGRRSAREVSNVNANGAGRVITPLKGIWESAILPMGRKMLCNLQQGLDEEQLVRIIGLVNFILNAQPQPMPFMPTQPGMPPPMGPSVVQQFMPVDKNSLLGAYDFTIFEGTLPSQRTAIAQSLAVAGDILMKNPTSVFVLQKDPKLLFDAWLELQGIRNAERFDLTPQRAQELIMLAGLARNAGGPPAPEKQGNGGPPGKS